MRAARQGVSGVPHPLDGRIYRDPSGANAAAADSCQRHPDQRPGAGAGQMVQPAARIRLFDLRRGDAGYFRAHGNTAPLRDDRAAPRPVRAGAVRTWFQGNDGRRNSAGKRLAGFVVALGQIRKSENRFSLGTNAKLLPGDHAQTGRWARARFNSVETCSWRRLSTLTPPTP